jgi:Integrase core domain
VLRGISPHPYERRTLSSTRRVLRARAWRIPRRSPRPMRCRPSRRDTPLRLTMRPSAKALNIPKHRDRPDHKGDQAEPLPNLLIPDIDSLCAKRARAECGLHNELRVARLRQCQRYTRALKRTESRLYELLNGEIFYTLREAQIVIESWRRHYNTIRPHASIGYKPPAPEVFVPAFAAWPAALRRPAPPATLAQRPTLS